MSDALHEIRFPNEGSAYRAARNALLEAEIGLRRQSAQLWSRTIAGRLFHPLLASPIKGEGHEGRMAA
jgi:hypothetical protein